MRRSFTVRKHNQTSICLLRHEQEKRITPGWKISPGINYTRSGSPASPTSHRGIPPGAGRTAPRRAGAPGSPRGSCTRLLSQPRSRGVPAGGRGSAGRGSGAAARLPGAAGVLRVGSAWNRGWGRNKPWGGSKRRPPGAPGRVNRRGSVGLGGESGGRAGEGEG